MKKALIILSLIVLIIGAKAQGNLQFNQVITGVASLAAAATSGILTVPANKVWKIEAVNSSSGIMSMQINSINVPLSNCVFPFWLKAGNTFTIYNSYSASTVHYSIIEFNIIP